MLEVKVCVGSSCYKRGAADVVKELRRLLAELGLETQVELRGSFCMERCTEGTTVAVGGKVLAGIVPGDVERLVREEVLPRLECRRRVE